MEKSIAQQKIEELNHLQNDLRKDLPVEERLESEKRKSIYSQQRFFGKAEAKTTTQEFVEELPDTISAPAA